jgi:hypothetical protein
MKNGSVKYFQYSTGMMETASFAAFLTCSDTFGFGGTGGIKSSNPVATGSVPGFASAAGADDDDDAATVCRTAVS